MGVDSRVYRGVRHWQYYGQQFKACGELAGSTTALQLPDVECEFAYLKAKSDNAGRVYIGGAGVTVADGTTDITTGYELEAGDEMTVWVHNLNELYRICDNAGDDLSYIAWGM
jgi:hypothetical protein